MPSRDTLKTLYLHYHSAYGHRLGMMLTKVEDLLPIEIRLIWMHIIWIWPFDHMVLRDHVTHWNHYISTNAMLMSTMLGRMVTNLEGLLPVMLLDPLVTWSWQITWELKPLYLHYHSAHGHKTWYDGDLPLVASIKEATWSYNRTVLRDHVKN